MPGVNFKMAKCRALNLVKKLNTKSSVWTYFGLEADESDKPLRDKEDSPVCRACKKSVRAKGGNTSNLLTHFCVIIILIGTLRLVLLTCHICTMCTLCTFIPYSSLYCINIIYEC